MDLLHIVLALLLVALNAFFVATEFAIVKVRRTRIDELVDQGHRRAVAVREVHAYLSATQLGITLTSLGLGWVGEPAFAHLLEPLFRSLGFLSPVATHTSAITLAFLVITFLHVVFGELAPKTLAIERAEATALLASRPIRAFAWLFHPLIVVLNGAAGFAVRLMGLPPITDAERAHSEEELRMILAVSHRSGILSEDHARLLENVLDFADRTVRQIMVPRGDIVFLDVNRAYADNLSTAREFGHTRYPLCDGDLDTIVGVVHIKDLFLSPPVGGGEVDLRSIAREPLFLPESLDLENVLARFQKAHLHLGLVIDEYGGTSGIVSLEDVLEELTGEIQDEFDQEPPKVQPLPDGRVSVDASLPKDEIEELGIDEDGDEEVDTIGGLVLARLGRIARLGDVVEIGGRKIEVSRVRGRRILRLIVHPKETA